MTSLPEQYKSYEATDRLDYEGEALYDYINGGAELYISYGLKGMTGCKYNGENLPQVTVEVYEMTTSENAFGVYTQSRDKEEYDYGQGSQSYDDFILFWKDKYFVIITTQKSTPESRDAVRYMAELTDAAITGKGEIPAIIRELPSEGLAPGGFLYFHHYIWLNAYIFIADYNIVDINDQTDAVLAKYGPADARCYLLMVEYPRAEAAEAAGMKLKEKFAPELTPDNRIIRLEDNTWFTMKVKENKLCAIFNGDTREQVESLYISILK
ncbi:MAG: hypothetical protein LBJ58_00120 [Tannerellaceae bacterium]|jgi:hypothetical protein|nr:hypothetical protein [Tannerellaceae bacterium]